MFDALNGRKWAVLLRKTVIGLIIGDAVPKLLSAQPIAGCLSVSHQSSLYNFQRIRGDHPNYP